MLWADRIAKEIQETRKPRDGVSFLIRDEKTLSGRVHVGSMRGVAVHGLVSEVLEERGIENRYHYELNDFDPFDSIPGYLDKEKFTEHLGKPLFSVPSPEPGFANYAEYFGEEFVVAHKKAGFNPDYYRATELYRSGKMDVLIKTALERTSEIKRILKDVSGSVKDDAWLPISVICEKCGKIMTTRAYEFDGDTVGFTCDKNPDDVKSCGHSGRIAPWGGNAKLFWKVEWAAKWVAMQVDIEGGGKDHSTKGGSRDVANNICREIFDTEPPFDIPYEFFLIGGKKMSSSKGRGSSAKDMCDLFPPELFRLILIGKDIREQIDIDPSGESVSRVYDWYDELADNARNGLANDFSRLYALCELPNNRAGFIVPWQMRFREVAFIVQMAHLSLNDEAARVKGSELTDDDKSALNIRALYAKYWLSTYAPEEFKYTIQQSASGVALSDVQRSAMRSLLDFFEHNAEATPEEVHQKIHELKTSVPVSPKDLFGAIYRIFLNRDSGPKAGWFLAGLPRDLVIERLREAVSA